MTNIWQSPNWPNFDYDRSKTGPLLAAFFEQIGELRGLHVGLSAQESEEILLREIAREAVHSFGIEGVALDPAEIEASVVASLVDRNLQGATRQSDDVAAVMLQAREPALKLTDGVLFQWHRLLFRKSGGEELGRWRSFKMVIVKSAVAGREEVLYTAVPAEQVSGEMAKFLRWLGEEQGEPLPVKAALAHLWFESIHPFADGNGRIGRALIEHVFARSSALPFSLSRQIEAEKKEYYAALRAGRKEGEAAIEATAFVTWFLQALCRAADRATAEARFLVRRNRFFLAYGGSLNTRQDLVLRKLFEAGSERVEQGIAARAYTRISKTSSATATRDLTELAAIGVLVRAREGGRSTRYHVNY